MIRVYLKVELPREEFTVDLEPRQGITNASDPAELAEELLAKAVADATAWTEKRKYKPGASA